VGLIFNIYVMFNLIDPNISYMLLSASKEGSNDFINKIQNEKLNSVLYSKDYNIIPVKGYLNGIWEDSFIAVCAYDNETLKTDVIFLIDYFNQDSIIVKYKGDTICKKIKMDGSEKNLGMIKYNSDDKNKTYIWNGLSFSFIEEKSYFYPKSKDDLKVGMIVEYFNNEKWSQKQIKNLDSEWENIWKLMSKYSKLRLEID